MLATLPLWLILTFIAGIAATGYNFSTKMAGNQINGFLFVCLLNAAATVAAFIALIFMNSSAAESLLSLPEQKSGLFWAAFGGASVFVINICFFLIFEKGGEVSTCIPLVSAINIVTIAAIGILCFGESISVYKIIGILMATTSIFLLSK
ncbi:MAG: hypothetical protein GY804_11215 [Alphaproteobacteria bacterium]|nr:hypothetical protein [Alphaproteobacteria bacterium]